MITKETATDVSKKSQDMALMLHELYERGQKISAYYMNQGFSCESKTPWNSEGVQKAFLNVWSKALDAPHILQDATFSYLSSLKKLRTGVVKQWFDPLFEWEPVIQSTKDDKRFHHEKWNSPYFNYLKQSYLLWDQWIHTMLESVEGIDKKTAHQVSFFTKQFTHALSPNNFFHLNPQVIMETLETGGLNLIKGMNNFLQDLEAGQGTLKISMVEKEAFSLGDNIATTPGSVVFQNDLIQLIQYKATTQKVYETPLLLVPPCINKYYIYDLREDNSFVKWMVDQGFTVFMISWVNPDEKLAHKTFEDYALEGVGAALQTITRLTNHPHVHGMGFCIGGNILSVYSASTRDTYLKSITFLATPFDFEAVGDLQVFINEDQLNKIESYTQEKGYFDGKILAKTFNFMRANDLIWSFIINNYMLGKSPMAFDILHWNNDTTRLPAAMYMYYLKNFFLKNLLIKPGFLTIKDQPVDLRSIKAPMYILNTHRDHIIPWECGYRGAQVMNKETLFVLGGSGHVAGIFNHPNSHKYGYWVGESNDLSSEAWFESATEHKGSWWPHWVNWATGHGNKRIPKRPIGSKDYPIIEPAPGSYVKVMND